jgi:G3E family GTPase
MIETSAADLSTLAPMEAQLLPCAFRADDAAAAIDHGAAFRSWAYRREGAFDRVRLASALNRLPPELLRLKGSCRLDGEAQAQVFQMVDKAWSLSPPDRPVAAQGIVLVGVGTAELPTPAELDAILDRALAGAGS